MSNCRYIDHEYLCEKEELEAEVAELRREAERLQKRCNLFEESFNSAKACWHAACNDIDKRDKALRRVVEALSNKEVEWSAGSMRNRCPWCDGLYDEHRRGCERQSALLEIREVPDVVEG